MAWTYDQSDGSLYQNGAYAGQGYSGTGEGRNNPLLQNIVGVGPIPRGEYKIGLPRKHTTLGPIVMNLDPVGHDALGRTLFRIHGDNTKGDASNGCIILSRPLRKWIADSKDRVLYVV